tara:strand:- start:4505 stop:5113 length:609 start_codon:yes stop_codon:yes gene_type:complete
MDSLKNTLLAMLVILVISCEEDSKKLKQEVKNTTTKIKNTSKVAEDGDIMLENIEKLKQVTPVSKEQFESWVAETLIDLPKASSMINFIPGLSSSGTTYSKQNKSVRVMVIDGAGEKGASGVGPYRMSSTMDYDQEDEWGYTKSRIINGIKVKESYRKSGEAYTLSMFYGDRFAVDVKTSKVTKEELDDIMKELNLEQLLKF